MWKNLYLKKIRKYIECLVLNSLKLKTGLFAKCSVKPDFCLVFMNLLRLKSTKNLSNAAVNNCVWICLEC